MPAAWGAVGLGEGQAGGAVSDGQTPPSAGERGAALGQEARAACRWGAEPASLLLPPQLALYVLSFLEPRDLLRAAQTCRYWRILAEDNLLWREKCRDVGEGLSLPAWLSGSCPSSCSGRPLLPAGIEEPLSLRRRRLLSPGFMYSPWKLAFLRQHRIDMNWRGGDARPPKVQGRGLLGLRQDVLRR